MSDRERTIIMFSVILPGRPCLTDMTTVSQTQFAFSFPVAPHFSHVVVFILPGNVLPSDAAAAVYMQLPGDQQFRFLGAIANEKPSAIFKVNLPGNAGENSMSGSSMIGDQGAVTLGISVEPLASVQAQLAQLKEQQAGDSTALTRRPPSTKILAQRIIKNAFNFLASFAGGQGGQEVVPLKSFEDWWRKFERRVENDPGFLERDDD